MGVASHQCVMMLSRLMQTIALVLLGLAILIVAGGAMLGEIAAHPLRLRPSHAKLPGLLAFENPLARVEDVELTASDGTLLRGMFAVPEKQNGSAVMLFDGISDNCMGVLGFARWFLANGYGVLLVDLRAQGTSGRLGQYVARPFTDIAYRYFKWRYGPDLDAANPIDTVSRSRTPILLIHGQADRNVLPCNSEEIPAASHGNTELWRVTGAGHCGAWSTEPQQFQKRVLEWFDAHQAPIHGCGTATSRVGS